MKKTKPPKRQSRRDEFIKAVAVMITRNLATKSILLEMENQEALDWAAVFSAAGCNGYPTADEAEKSIRRTLELT